MCVCGVLFFFTLSIYVCCNGSCMHLFTIWNLNLFKIDHSSSEYLSFYQSVKTTTTLLNAWKYKGKKYFENAEVPLQRSHNLIKYYQFFQSNDKITRQSSRKTHVFFIFIFYRKSTDERGSEENCELSPINRAPETKAYLQQPDPEDE